MFKIVAAPMAWWPVVFCSVSEDGDVIDNEFEMRFRILDEDEHVAFLIKNTSKVDDVMGKTGSAPSAVSLTLIKEIAVDWRKVAAENGEALKFDDEHLTMLLKVPNVFRAILQAYADCRSARPKERAGN